MISLVHSFRRLFVRSVVEDFVYFANEEEGVGRRTGDRREEGKVMRKEIILRTLLSS